MTSVFDKIFESSPIAQIAIDENSKIKIANKQAEKLFGYNKSELVEKNIDLLVPLESKQRHPKLVKAFFESPIPRIMGQGRNLFGLKKNGVLFPIEIGLAPVETDTGLWVVSSIIDLSKQYYAEERFRSAVESAPNGMLMIDSNGSIVMVNKQIEKLFEYDRNELLDMAIEILVPDEFKQHHPRFIESYIKNPIPRAMGIGRELYGRTKGGRLFPVEIGLQPLKERENSIYVLASVVDISTRRKAEKELEEKSEELQEFAYRTSHDLKSPLTTLTSIIKCVEEDLVENDINEATSNLNKAYSIAKNLQSLVQTLLFLTKAELDSENSSPFKFDQFLENFLLNHQSQIEESEVQIKTHFIHSKPFSTKHSKLSQVIENLMNNAVKFSNPNAPKKIVEISTYNDVDWFYIQIKDNGLGIPEDRHSEVFSMFKRFHQNVEGHGIGLYMVKKFVDKLNGEINFESSLENGTCFYVKLPFERQDRPLPKN